MGKGRRCRVCAARGRDSRTKRGLRHLHELEVGSKFQKPGTDGRGENGVYKLLRTGELDATIQGVENLPGEEVTFTTIDGEVVRFTRPPSSQTRRVAPGMTVVPLEERR